MGRYDCTGTLLESCKCFFLFRVLTTEVCSICKNSRSCTLRICAHFRICVLMRSLKFYKYMDIIYTREWRGRILSVPGSNISPEIGTLSTSFLFPFPYLKKGATLLWSPRATLCLSEKILQFSASFTQLKNTWECPLYVLYIWECFHHQCIFRNISPF